MSTLELKSSFHQLIDKVDESILQDMYDTFNQYLITDSSVLALDNCTPERLTRLKQAIKSVEQGNYITTDELRKKFKEWNMR
jgi:hypothetical protein